MDLSDPSAAPSGAVTAPARPAKSGPMTDFWVYEDVCVPVAHASIAAAGLSAVEIELAPTAYSDMRQGFYEPKARLEDMESTTSNGRSVFRPFPDSAASVFSRRVTRTLRSHVYVLITTGWWMSGAETLPGGLSHCA